QRARPTWPPRRAAAEWSFWTSPEPPYRLQPGSARRKKIGIRTNRSLTWALESAPVAGFRYVVCDVFTDVPLQGNQLAVFTDAREIPEPQLQRLAKELCFSETVFVY